MNKKHIVIFSHGFGVRKDSSLFVAIKERLQTHGIESVLFAYNVINEETNELTVAPFSEQSKILQRVLDDVRTDNPDAVIDIIASSQGAAMVALARLVGIRKVIFLAPFFHTNIHDVIERHKKFPTSHIDFNGVSRRTRTDGSTTIIPSTYWTERFATDIYALYNTLALKVDLTIINATEDEIMDQCNLSKILNTFILNIEGNHDFSNTGRNQLLDAIDTIVGK